MIRRLQRMRSPLVGELYSRVLDEIMNQNNIDSPQYRPDHVVRANANLTQVAQNTKYYCCSGGNPPYRYRRYREVLGCMRPSGNREAHVDIGCGAGLFSWVFLDWARAANVPFDRVDLYGLDHSPAMINLARRMRTGLARNVGNYPSIHYTHNVDSLLNEITNRHRAGTDYTITFGHVLAQARTPGAIRNFARVIAHIIRLLDAQANCALMAVDARNWSSAFASGWDALLDSIGRAGISHELANVPITAVNDPGRAKIAWLSHTGTTGRHEGGYVGGYGRYNDDVDDLPF